MPCDIPQHLVVCCGHPLQLDFPHLGSRGIPSGSPWEIPSNTGKAHYNEAISMALTWGWHMPCSGTAMTLPRAFITPPWRSWQFHGSPMTIH